MHKNLYQGYRETLVVSLHHSTGKSNLDFNVDHVGVLHREWEQFSLVENNNHLIKGMAFPLIILEEDLIPYHLRTNAEAETPIL